MSNLLWYWHYRLKSRRDLNSRSPRREFEGLLLRDGEGGYACVHPWPELGDPSLQRCLDDLSGPRRWPIIRRSLRCLEMDGAARSLKDPLFEDLELPPSHATLTGCDVALVAKAVESGFSAVKLKCGHDPALEMGFLAEMGGLHQELRWRLDFNESCDADHLIALLAGLPPGIRERIDFIEDPCPFSESKWDKLWREGQVPLAVDRESGPHRVAAQFVVIKPAIDEPWLLAEAAAERGQRVVVTSYMDHPLGQSFAAWEAGRLALQFPGLVGVCGLQTHHLFEADAFTEALGPWTPDFHAAPGTGLGFDDLLEKLPWKRVP